MITQSQDLTDHGNHHTVGTGLKNPVNPGVQSAMVQIELFGERSLQNRKNAVQLLFIRRGHDGSLWSYSQL